LIIEWKALSPHVSLQWQCWPVQSVWSMQTKVTYGYDEAIRDTMTSVKESAYSVHGNVELKSRLLEDKRVEDSTLQQPECSGIYTFQGWRSIHIQSIYDILLCIVTEILFLFTWHLMVKIFLLRSHAGQSTARYRNRQLIFPISVAAVRSSPHFNRDSH